MYAWILNTEKKLPAYVTRRLEKIRSIIKVSELKLVPSKLNPADIASRGMSPKELSQNESFWFSGPEFLHLPESSWPNLKIGDKFKDYNIDVAQLMTTIDPAPVPSPYAKIKENEITNSCNVTKLIDAS